jgi:hypothetical protein
MIEHPAGLASYISQKCTEVEHFGGRIAAALPLARACERACSGTSSWMATIRATASGYYSAHEALRAAEQLIDLLEKEHKRGYFQLEDVILRSEDTDLVFSGAEYLAFALKGIREAQALTSTQRVG